MMAEFKIRRSLENIEEYKVEHVDAKIIVSANESNYPMPEAVAAKVAQLTANFPFNRYPPMKAENLCGTIASELGFDIDNIKIGNGSSELLEMACYAFGGAGKKIAFPYPSFGMYNVFARMSDSTPAPYALTEDGYIDADAVIGFCKAEQPSLLIICNPNNPTGNYNQLPVMERIVASVNCPVLVDEAYMEFADGRDVPPTDMRPLNKLWLVAGSTLSLVGQYSNLICLRTFSKAYGLAGLRCGYAAGAIGLMRLLGKTLIPYQVNAYSLMVAQTVYENKLLYKDRIKEIKFERDKMAAELKQIGFRVWDSATNFLLMRAEGALAEKLAKNHYVKSGEQLSALQASGKLIYRYLLDNGILTADFTSHPALTGCLRITVGLPAENAVIMEKLRQLVRS